MSKNNRKNDVSAFPFIRDVIPVAVTRWEKCMLTGEEYEKADGSSEEMRKVAEE